MENLKNKIAVVAGCGIELELAITLSKSFKKVYYFTPWNYSGFPNRLPELTGVGFEEITSIDYLFASPDRSTDYDFNKVDLFIFPELYFYDIERLLRSMGKRVWGSGDGQWLELDRYDSKKIMAKNNMPVNKTVKVTGISKLKDYLKDHDNVYVKISHWRGLIESFKSESYKLSETLLVDIENRLGATKEITDFIIEQPVDCIVETGIDTFIIDGKMPRKALSGIEIKDQCYISKVFDYDSLPKCIKLCTDNLLNYFKEKKYRNFYSNEIRVDKNKVPYAIDQTCRIGSPPLSIQLNLIKNLAEIIWFGAEGILIEPEFTHKYGVMIIGYFDVLKNTFLPIYFPEKIRSNIKLKYTMKSKGSYYIIPQKLDDPPGCIDIVATGNTLDDCLSQIKEYADQVKGYGLILKYDSLEKAKEELVKSEKIGLKF